MSNVKLKKIQIQSFRSFVNAEVDFPKTGLVLIRGENPETGDPSGSGKSSLLLAIAYVLDILPPEFPATELQSWKSELPMQVVLTLEIDGKEYVFSRGKKNFIREAGCEPTTGSKAIAERQQALLGFTPAIVQALTYRAQNTSGLFLSLPPADKSEFLTSVLDLGSIEDAVDKAEKKIGDLEVKQTVVASLLAPAKMELEGLVRPVGLNLDVQTIRAIYNNLKKATTDMQSVIVMSNSELEAAVKADSRQKDIQDISEKLSKARMFLTDLRAKDNEALGVIERQKDVLRTNIRNYDTAIQKFESQIAERARCQHELEKIKQGFCPTCESSWIGPSALTNSVRLQERIRLLESEASAKTLFERQRAEAEAQIVALTFKANPAIEKLVTIEKSLLTDLATAQASRESQSVVKIKARIEAEKAKLATLKAAELESLAELRIAEHSMATFASSMAQYTEQHAAKSARITQLEAQKSELATEIAIEKDFVAMMGREGFLGVIFDDVLREISDEANARLGRLANVSHVGLSFTSETTNQKGKVRKQIQANVNVGGKPTKYKSGLSGGMLTSVEQVVDLGVMSVISRRAGRTLGWLCLDEVFNGQGAMTKESALEVLKEFSQDRLVLVIDHGSEFKEAFTQTITVEQIGGVSRIKS